MTEDPLPSHYDIVICGAGIAGLSLARYLTLQKGEYFRPRIALIERDCPENRSDQKVGEALVEQSTAFFVRELGMRDYLVKNMATKKGINWQYSRQPQRNLCHLEDDYHVFYNPRHALLESFFVDRAKIETFMSTQLQTEENVTLIHGTIVDVHIKNNTSNVHLVEYRDDEGKKSISADFLVDCSGRRFLTGLKYHNLSRDGIRVCQSAAWFRVRDYDRSILDANGLFQYNADGSLNPRYFSTSHLCSDGCYIWMIPLDTDVRFLSIGVTYYPTRFKTDCGSHLMINSQQKLLEFFKNRYKMLYDLINSGSIHDFQYTTNMAYESKTYYSAQDWAVVGVSGSFIDPMGSFGIGLVALQIIQTSEIIKQTFMGEKYVNPHEQRTEGKTFPLEMRIRAYNEYYRSLMHLTFDLFEAQPQILGHAEAMSIFVTFFNSVYFGFLLPSYLSLQDINSAHCERAVQRYFPKARGIIREANWLLKRLSKQKFNTKFPVTFQFATWNILIYSSWYTPPNKFEDNSAGNPADIDPNIVFDAYEKFSSVALGQLSCWTDGFFQSMLKLFQKPIQDEDGPRPPVSFQIHRYPFFAGAISMANPILFYLFALIPTFPFDKAYRLKKECLFWVPDVFGRYLTFLMKQTYVRTGVPVSMLNTKPNTFEANRNFWIRYIPSSVLLTCFGYLTYQVFKK